MARVLLHPAVKPLLHGLCLLPLAWLVYAAAFDHLGANPAEALIRSLGGWTLRLLCLTLAVTPLRQMLGLPALARFRRMLGVYTFCYALLHLLNFVGLDYAFNLSQIFQDAVLSKPYIVAGLACLLLLVPLAATSTRGWMRRLGRNWKQLHRLAYAAGVLAVLHFLWQAKAAERWEPLLYAVGLGLLLFVRIPGVRHWIVKTRGAVMGRKAVPTPGGTRMVRTPRHNAMQHSAPQTEAQTDIAAEM